MAKKMDAFSASLMADKREIIFAPTVYKFDTFAAKSTMSFFTIIQINEIIESFHFCKNALLKN